MEEDAEDKAAQQAQDDDEDEDDDESSDEEAEAGDQGDDDDDGRAHRHGRKSKESRKKRLIRLLRLICSRQNLRWPKCKCCVHFFPCMYCCGPDQMQDKKVLIDQLKKASGGKPVNMLLVEETLTADRERRREHKHHWKRRWRICQLGFLSVILIAMIVFVVIFAISPWTQLCDDCDFGGRAYFGAVLRDERIIITGGRDGSKNFGDVWSGNLDGTSWNRLIEIADFGPRHGHAFLHDRKDGDLFVIGGDIGGVGQYDQTPMRDVWRSRDGRDWVLQVEEAPWAARKFAGATTDSEGRLFIAGGLSGHGEGGLNDVWRSEDKGVTWQPVALTAPWSARHSFPLIRMEGGTLKDRLFLLGGMDGYERHDVWIGEPDASSWQLMTFTHRRDRSYNAFEERASWEPRMASAAVADTDGFQVFGGHLDKEGPEGFYSRESWGLPSPKEAPQEWYAKTSRDDRLNVRHIPEEWARKADPPWHARSGHQALVDLDTGTIYILGGEGRDGFKADLWKEAFSINFNNLYNMVELLYLQVMFR